MRANLQKTAIQRLLGRMSEWPESWKMDQDDLATGTELVRIFASFVEHLAALGLAPKTVERHAANLWLLGGEIIRQLNLYSDQRQRTAVEVIVSSVDDEGGPLSAHLQSDGDKTSFDATCRKLYAFLTSERNVSRRRASAPGR